MVNAVTASLSKDENRNAVLTETSYSLPHPRSPKETSESPTIYTEQNVWSFMRAATWQYHMPESRIRVFPAYMVTLYNAKYTSLRSNHDLPVLQHSLTNISPEDIKTFSADVEYTMRMWNRRVTTEDFGVDWQSVVKEVVNRYADRLSEMREVMESVSSSTDIATVVSNIHIVAFAMGMPYINSPSVLGANASSIDRRNSLALSVEKCTSAFTGHIHLLSQELTEQELRLILAIEGVLSRICTFVMRTLDQSLALMRNESKSRARSTVEVWRTDLHELMSWLGWATWTRCPRVCAWDVRGHISSIFASAPKEKLGAMLSTDVARVDSKRKRKSSEDAQRACRVTASMLEEDRFRVLKAHLDVTIRSS